MSTYTAYQREMQRCLLASIDQKKPFVSVELERLRQKIRSTGIRDDARLETDLKQIESAAFGTEYEDGRGKRYHPVTRSDIMRGAKEVEITDQNFKKLGAVFAELVAAYPKK